MKPIDPNQISTASGETHATERRQLRELILDCAPPGDRSIAAVARELRMTAQGVYRWTDAGRIPPAYVPALVEMSAGRVTLDQLLPYVLK